MANVIEHVDYTAGSGASALVGAPALNALEQRWNALAQATGQIVWIADAEGRERDLAAWRAFTGQAAGEFWMEAVHPEDRARIQALWRAALAGKQVYLAEHRVRRADGAYRTLLTRAVPVLDPDGSLREWVGLSTDITELRAAEAARQASETTLAAAQASEARFRRLVDANIIGVCFSQRDTISDANDAFLSLAGSTREEVRQGALSWSALVPPDYAEAEARAYKELQANGECAPHEIELLRKDGTRVPVLLGAAILDARDAAPFTAVAFVLDLTAQRRLADSVADVASQLEATFNAMADGVFVYDAEGRVVQMNSAGQRLFGLDASEASERAYQARALYERVAPFQPRDVEGRPLPQARWPQQRILRGETLQSSDENDTLVRTRDGRELILGITGGPLRDLDGRIIGGVLVLRDISERRRLERQTAAALDALLAMAETLMVSDPGQGSEDAQGRDAAPIAQEVAGDEAGRQPAAASAIARRLAILTQRVLGCERIGIGALDPANPLDGRIRPLAAVGMSPELESAWWKSVPTFSLRDYFDESVLRSLVEGRTALVHYAESPPVTGGPTFDTHSPLLAPLRINGELIGVISIDYGAKPHTYTRRERELFGAVSQLSALALERERMLRARAESEADALALRKVNEHLLTFLSVAGHELRTPVTAIKASVQFATRSVRASLADELPATLGAKLTRAHSLLESAERQTGRLERLIGDLLDLSRMQAGILSLRLAPGDLRAVARDVIAEERLAWPERPIELVIAPDAPAEVTLDADRIGQVITNYLTNALKYSPADRPVSVWLGARAGVARVEVRDSGPGLTPEAQQRVWEPFHQEQPAPEQNAVGGVGLGLYICRTIVERHHGRVGVESAPGAGSTFWFELPLSE